MIKSKPYYWVTCDKCSKRCDYYEHSAFGLWAEEWTAVEYAEADDWITHGDKHFCPDCQVVCEDCDTCGSSYCGDFVPVEYPCPTVTAIHQALGEGE